MQRLWFNQNTATSSEYENEILAEKIRVVRRNTPMILLGNLLGSVPLLIVFWGGDYATRVICWSIALYIMLAIRMVHYHYPGNTISTHKEIFRYGRNQTFLIFLTGCVWGAGGAALFDAENINNLAYLILTFISMIAGSMVSLSSRPLSYILFSAPLMLPMILSMVTQDQVMYRWMGFGAVVYLFATFGFSRTVHRVIDNSIRLKYANLDLIADLQQQTDRANRASEEKSRFLASASHDLRQPLQAVNLYTEILAAKVKDPEQQADLRNIRQGVGALNELLDALFDVSHLDSGNVQVRRASFVVEDILRKLERQFQLKARLQGLEFNVNYGRHVVNSDPILLERVITNLLVNAFRYTEQGRIDVFFESGKGNALQVHIRDTGIGISAENLEAIFQEFFQVQNQERDRRQGLGLGLAIVRRIISLLGHDIEVRSELGRGTEFIVTLPRGREEDCPLPELSRVEGSAKEGSLNGLRVMIVDNEALILEAMDSLIASWGAECTGFLTTEAALQAVRDGYIPQMLIADYRMPGKYNGCQLVAEIRALLADVPALIVTGDTSDEVVEEFRRERLDYLHKPIKPAQLRMLVSRALKRDRQPNRAEHEADEC